MRPPGLVITLVVFAVLLAAPAAALAHGEEGEAAAEVPSRSLVQQALALLTQADDPAEATEKLEAALESKDHEGVDTAAVGEALDALEMNDHELAIEHVNAALGAAPEEPAAGGGPAEAEDEAAHEEEMAAGEEPEVSEEALEHADEFEPDRGNAEWVALALGIALGAAALALLGAQGRAG